MYPPALLSYDDSSRVGNETLSRPREVLSESSPRERARRTITSRFDSDSRARASVYLTSGIPLRSSSAPRKILTSGKEGERILHETCNTHCYFPSLYLDLFYVRAQNGRNIRRSREREKSEPKSGEMKFIFEKCVTAPSPPPPPRKIDVSASRRTRGAASYCY